MHLILRCMVSLVTSKHVEKEIGLVHHFPLETITLQ
jgi:hypothetical protein